MKPPHVANHFETPMSEVSAKEFLSRMDMSIEATRQSVKKSSSSTALASSDFGSTNDPLSATAYPTSSDRGTSSKLGGDKNRIVC